MASWCFLLWCSVCVHAAHGNQVGVYAHLFGHEQFDAEARVIKHEHHVVAVWKFLDELERGGKAGGIETDAGEPVVQDIEADLRTDGFDGVTGFDHHKVAQRVSIECLPAEVIDALLYQVPDGGVADLIGGFQIMNDAHGVPPGMVSVLGIDGMRVGGKHHAAGIRR